jgi:hypothetical protein
MQQEFGVEEHVLPWPMQRLVPGWMTDRLLGPDWPAFVDGARR